MNPSNDQCEMNDTRQLSSSPLLTPGHDCQTQPPDLQNPLGSSKRCHPFQVRRMIHWRLYPLLLTTTSILFAMETAAFSSSLQKFDRGTLHPSTRQLEQRRLFRYRQWATRSITATVIPSPSMFLPFFSLHMSSSSSSENSNNSWDATPATFSDEDEWRAILAAFRMYKAAYGDLKVPSRFVVPSLPPWPENAWGLKLGHRVAAIRATGRFVKDQPDRLKALEKLGFQWQLRSGSSSSDGLDGVSLDQIYTALATYREMQPLGSGQLSVPPNFSVPNSPPWPESTRGLPLGKLLPLVRSKAFLKSNPEAKQRLESLDVELDGKTAMNDARFQKVYEALQRYNELYGDLLVPQPFVVPKSSPDWAEDLWGLRLGARVNAIRSQGTFVSNNPERKKLLDDLGFMWSPPPTDRGRKRGRKSKAEMDQAGNSNKEGYDVGDDGEDSRRSDRTERGFDFSAEEGEEEDGRYESTSPSSSVETWFGQSFDFGSSPPDGPPQAPPTWGLQQPQDGIRGSDMSSMDEETNKAIKDFQQPRLLSNTLKEAAERAIEVGVIEPIGEGNEGKRVKKGKREKDIPWFNDDFGAEFVFEDVVEALTIYKSMYGDFSNLTKGEFVIPNGGNGGNVFGDYSPVESFDVEASARAAAAIAAYRKRNQLAESEDLIATEIQRLQDDIIPSRNERKAALQLQSSAAQEWPEHLAGMALGNIVNRIRDGSLEVKHLPERKAQLDELDFDWGDPRYFIDIPFEKAMCAMYAYYLVRGDMFVYEDFVIPDEDPWPKILANYEIGKAVKRIREQQYFLEAYHPDKVSLLRMIDFMWFPTVALPLDPNEPEMTSELLLLNAMGHPDYAKMVDIPMGLPDKIVADGPFYETEDPKFWWRKWHNWEYVKDYWYQQGRRDNAFVLRIMGYPQMADEHEALYGPGLFKQLDEVMKQLEEGIEWRTQEEKEEILTKLNDIRLEMTDCSDIHPQDRAILIDELDSQIHALVTEGKSDVNKISRFQTEVYQYEMPDGEPNGQYEAEEGQSVDEKENRGEDEDEEKENRGEDEDEDDDLDDSDDIDVEEELGLYQ